MKTIREIKSTACQELKGNWSDPVLAFFVYLLISMAIGTVSIVGNITQTTSLILSGSAIQIILGILILFPVSFGLAYVFLQFVRGDKYEMTGKMFCFFKNGQYGRSIGLTLLVTIYTFLWTLLLIIPGIIKSFSYALSYYVSFDHPELSADECINRSKEMMYGHKWQLFVLYLSFIGWFILGFISFGIGFLWITPYLQTSVSVFYEEVKADYEAINGVTAENVETF